MARQGFKVLDSDMHVIEPVDLGPKYIEPAYRDRAPVGTRAGVRDIGIQLADGRSGAISDMRYDVWLKGSADHQAPLSHHFQFPLSDETKRKLLWDNCARLYRLE